MNYTQRNSMPGTTMFVALKDYRAQSHDKLTIQKGDIMQLLLETR